MQGWIEYRKITRCLKKHQNEKSGHEKHYYLQEYPVYTELASLSMDKESSTGAKMTIVLILNINH